MAKKLWIRRYEPFRGDAPRYQVVERGSVFVHQDERGLNVEFSTRSAARNWIKAQSALTEELEHV